MLVAQIVGRQVVVNGRLTDQNACPIRSRPSCPPPTTASSSRHVRSIDETAARVGRGRILPAWAPDPRRLKIHSVDTFAWDQHYPFNQCNPLSVERTGRCCAACWQSPKPVVCPCVWLCVSVKTNRKEDAKLLLLSIFTESNLPIG